MEAEIVETDGCVTLFCAELAIFSCRTSSSHNLTEYFVVAGACYRGSRVSHSDHATNRVVDEVGAVRGVRELSDAVGGVERGGGGRLHLADGAATPDAKYADL